MAESISAMARVSRVGFLVAACGLMIAALRVSRERHEPKQPSCRYSRGICDDVTLICEASLRFRSTSTGRVLKGDLAATGPVYVESCRLIFQHLDTSMQQCLLAALHRGDLDETLSWNFELSYPRSYARSCAVGVPKKTIADVPTRDVEHYRSTGMLPLQERTVQPSEAVSAFSQAEVVRFGAVKLLPSQFWNITIEDLNILHKNSTLDVLVFAENGDVQTLDWFAEQSLRFHRDEIPWSATLEQADDTYLKEQFYRRNGESIGAANLNVRRLLNFPQGENMVEQFGLRGLVDSTVSQLRFGNTPGVWHRDAQDNVYIQISGSVDILIFPVNCSFAADQIEWVKDEAIIAAFGLVGKLQGWSVESGALDYKAIEKSTSHNNLPGSCY